MPDTTRRRFLVTGGAVAAVGGIGLLNPDVAGATPAAPGGAVLRGGSPRGRPPAGRLGGMAGDGGVVGSPRPARSPATMPAWSVSRHQELSRR